MGAIAIAVPTLSDQATVTADSAVGTLPPGNLQRPQPGEVWRTTAIAGAFLEIDLGQGSTVNLVALLFTNATSAATWRIRGATSQANLTAAPGYDSTTLTLWPTTGLEDWPWVHGLRWLGAAPQTFRWWRIDLADGANPAGYLQAGRLYIAEAWQPSRNRLFNAPLGFVDPSVKTRSLSGALFTVERTPWRVADYALARLPEEEIYAEAFEIFRTRGASRDLLVLRDPDKTAQLMRQTLYGQLRDLATINDSGFDIHETRFRIEEMPP